MHEMGIAQSILDAAQAEARKHPGAVVERIGVRVGEWAGVDTESLRFCFEALTVDLLPRPVLELEFCPVQSLCLRCGKEFYNSEPVLACPQCGALATQRESGDELELSFVELEEAACAST